jgi:hypothetical protein
MSQNDLIAEHLAAFKASEEEYVHRGVVVAGDRDAQIVLSTWTTLPLERVKPKGTPPSDERELWDWLWTSVRINWSLFSDRTGMNTARLQKMFEPLKANRLVYPDGTVPKYALGILESEVLKALKGSQKKAQS